MKTNSLIILVLFFFSCTDSPKSPVTKYVLVEKDTLNIASSRTRGFSFMSYFKNAQAEYLTTSNRIENSIQFFDLKTQSLQFEVQFKSNGIDGLLGEGISGYYIHNLDSIFVYSLKTKELALADKSGSVYNRFYLDDEKNNDYVISCVGKVPLIFWKNKFYYFVLTNFPIRKEPPNGEIMDFEFDFKKLSSPKPVVSFPSIYKGVYGMKHTHPSRSLGKDALVYSFPITSDIYVYDLEKETFKSFSLPSKYAKNLVPPFSQNDSFFSTRMSEPIFKEIVYAPHNRVYYRFILHAIKDWNGDEYMNDYDDRAFSIQIIGEDFSLINEIKLPKNKYYQRDFFVNEKGLYLSLSNKNNNLDSLKFIRFELLPN